MSHANIKRATADDLKSSVITVASQRWWFCVSVMLC